MTTAGFEIRRCAKRDLSAVLALWAEARSGRASVPDRADDLERLLAEASAAVLVAVRGDAVIGTLIAGWDGWRGNLYRLAVRADCRKEGVATALIGAGEEHLQRCGARRVTALVAHEDEGAAPFWDSVGYPLDPLIGRRVRNL